MLLLDIALVIFLSAVGFRDCRRALGVVLLVLIVGSM
jgi:hypothetical protein